MSYLAYTSAPLDFVCDVTFDAGAGATSLADLDTLVVDAINTVTGVKVRGTATKATGRCTFAAGTLTAGRYEVQVLATKGTTAQVVSATLWQVKPGAAP